MKTSETFRTTSITSHADRLMACSMRQMKPTPYMSIHVYQRTSLIGAAISLDKEQVRELVIYLTRWMAEGWQV